ncbi:MAG: efflux RND transporter periplasmic adaptor subunit [Hydrogenophaga sp.]|uniref:efflux RND transporter periplasmic adaptor subunit n=1 Tax=Hydrogenophaga sp. TaxID=1904254 RepID=UPI001DE024B8|nr:efflux RND transporter periplasmic adaptor subunit [Hydrogenophaga sp.]MBW0170332.1 efflux RND transporter periplasmic adaptor subunit [Hydrogenophaga sp.]MBW0184961.1 efflux RND transporter periplasmic adaptor subunit [Hydrogenophaga sp.]
MATKSPMNARPEKKQFIIIAIILVLGAVGGTLILRGGESHGESDGHGHEEESSQVEGGASKAGAKEAGSSTSVEQSKSPASASEEGHKEDEEKVALTDEQVKAAGIVIKESGAAVIRTTLQLPGEIRFNEDRTAHIVPRAAGVVESVSANLGQKVSRGQILAVVSSSTVSEVRSELQAAAKRRELAQTTYEREHTLWEQKISPEQDVLQARQALREAEIAVANATQKLKTLGASVGSGALGRVELRAPFDAMVVEKHIAIGEAVREDANVFTLSDLSTVWAEMSVGASDLPKVRVGERVRVKADAADVVAEGKIAFVGSLIGAQTRTAPARVELSNPQGAWRPGLFVTVEVLTNENDKASAVTVDANALQTVEDKPSVFTKVDGGFVAKPVRVGRTDGQRVEILDGLKAGESYAADGSFVVKSEQGKSSATHAH